MPQLPAQRGAISLEEQKLIFSERKQGELGKGNHRAGDSWVREELKLRALSDRPRLEAGESGRAQISRAGRQALEFVLFS